MGLFNSQIVDVRRGQVIIDIGQTWVVGLAAWNSLPGSQPPRAGDYWAIDASSVANLLAGELPRQIQRTNDALDGMDDYFQEAYWRD